jgi:hypothetical protein
MAAFESKCLLSKQAQFIVPIDSCGGACACSQSPCRHRPCSHCSGARYDAAICALRFTIRPAHGLMHDTFATAITVTHCIPVVNISFFSELCQFVVTHARALTDATHADVCKVVTPNKGAWVRLAVRCATFHNNSALPCHYTEVYNVGTKIGVLMAAIAARYARVTHSLQTSLLW